VSRGAGPRLRLARPDGDPAAPYGAALLPRPQGRRGAAARDDRAGRPQRGEEAGRGGRGGRPVAARSPAHDGGGPPRRGNGPLDGAADRRAREPETTSRYDRRGAYLAHQHPASAPAFAGACAASSAYGFLHGAWPFGVVEPFWGTVARHRRHVRSGGGCRHWIWIADQGFCERERVGCYEADGAASAAQVRSSVGRARRKRAPWPGVESASSEPPWAVAMPRAR